MAIIENADYTLTGEQVIDLRDRVKSALQLPGTVIGNGAPTTSTEGNVGQFYYDTTNDKLYYCKAKTAQGTDPETYVYTWEENPDTTYSAGANISISEQNVISATGLPTVLTDPEYEELWAEPTPPEPVPTSDWGVFYYYSGWETEYTASGEECTINSIDSATLESFLEENPPEDPGMGIDFMYEESYDPETGDPTGEYVWKYGMMGDVEILPEDMAATTGIDVTVDAGAEFAFIMIEKETVVDTTSSVLSAELTQSEFESLGGGGDSYIIDGNNIPIEAVRRFVFGTEAEYTTSRFLGGCSNLLSVDMSLVQPTFLNIYDNFLQDCSSLTSLTGFPAHEVSIQDGFMNGCIAFNQPIAINVAATAQGFLSSCTSFNSPITFLRTDIVLGPGFLAGCRDFNQPLDLSKVKAISASFLSSCPSFNQPLTFAPGTSINSDSFMAYCSVFNQPLDFSGCTFNSNQVGGAFMIQCARFNSALVFPAAVDTIGNNFLASCSAFNQPLTFLNGILTIGTGFLWGCSSFNQNISLPSGMVKIGGFVGSTYFLYECNSMVGTIDVGSNPASIINADSSNSASAFATTNASAPSYTTGITLAGATAADWKAKFPDSAQSPYRKILLAS